MMNIRFAISEYVDQGRELLDRLRSSDEGPTATVVDLRILRVQLFLLDHEVANREQACMLSALPEVANVQRKRLSPPHGEKKMSIQSHSVQFYQDDTFLTESVTRFIREGLQANETVFIVATAQHREELRKVLTSQETTHDKLRFLDAGEQLSTFMVDGWPNERRFKNVIGGMIDQASKHGPVRVFGEMVAILWAEGQTRAALRLAELWNRLMEQQSFALLCAYPMANLSQEKDNNSILAISQLHTHVHNQSADRSHTSVTS